MKYVRSVQPDWCLALPIQQQSVLLLATRGPDGIPKRHPCKRIQAAYRGTVLVAAKYGRLLRWGEQADTFMSLHDMANGQLWDAAVNAFFWSIDELPHHFVLHLLHGTEIIGYNHPDPAFATAWKEFYLRGCEDMHLNPETEREMDNRLSDWNRDYWESLDADTDVFNPGVKASSEPGR